MIRHEEEIRIRHVTGAMGGEGTIKFSDWLLPEEAPGHGRLFSRVVIPAGASIGYHQHKGEFETYYILSGTATITDNGEVFVLKAGDMHMCKNGDCHGLENKSDEDVVMLASVMNDLA